MAIELEVRLRVPSPDGSQLEENLGRFLPRGAELTVRRDVESKPVWLEFSLGDEAAVRLDFETIQGDVWAHLDAGIIRSEASRWLAAILALLVAEAGDGEILDESEWMRLGRTPASAVLRRAIESSLLGSSSGERAARFVTESREGPSTPPH